MLVPCSTLPAVQDVGELGLCRIVLDLGVAGDGVTTDMPEDGGEEVDMRSQVTDTTTLLLTRFGYSFSL